MRRGAGLNPRPRGQRQPLEVDTRLSRTHSQGPELRPTQPGVGVWRLLELACGWAQGCHPSYPFPECSSSPGTSPARLGGRWAGRGGLPEAFLRQRLIVTLKDWTGQVILCRAQEQVVPTSMTPGPPHHRQHLLSCGTISTGLHLTLLTGWSWTAMPGPLPLG